MRKYIIVSLSLSVLFFVGFACGGAKGVEGENRGTTEEIPGGEYDYDEFASSEEAFTLIDPDIAYVLTKRGMSYGDLVEISHKDKTVKLLDRSVKLIDYSPEGGWIAYNRMHNLIHDQTNPGENADACSMYISPSYDIEEDGPHYMSPPPLGAYIYFERSGETKPLFTVTASSMLSEPDEPTDKFGPEKLVDGTRSTAWAEGVDGLGVGEWVELSAIVPISIHNIRVWGGFAESPATMTGNAHPAKMSVVLNGDNEAGYVKFSPPPEHSGYSGGWHNDPEGETTARAETIRLTIKEVKPGTEWKDCCISEIEVW